MGPQLFKPPYKGTFSMTVKLGKASGHLEGQLEKRKVLDLPQNYGSITFDGILFHPLPGPKPRASISLELELSTAPLHGGSIEVRVNGASNEKLMCLVISVFGPGQEAGQAQPKDDMKMLVVDLPGLCILSFLASF